MGIGSKKAKRLDVVIIPENAYIVQYILATFLELPTREAGQTVSIWV